MKARELIERIIGEPSGLYDNPVPEQDGEYVVSAAVLDRDTGDIYLSDDHTGARELDGFVHGHSYENGFFTNEGRFLSRAKAIALAKSKR